MFSVKEVVRAVKEFEDASNDLLLAESRLYQFRVERLVYIMDNNRVINHIVKPFLDMKIEHDEIVVQGPGVRWELNLPVKVDEQIAFVLQVFQASSTNPEFPKMDMYALNIFCGHSLDENVQRFNNQVVQPVLRELIRKLEQLIEDEVEGKDEISPSALTIVTNIENFSANGSNVAIGQNITQDMTNNAVNEIISELKNAGFDDATIDKAKPSLTELKTADNSISPERGEIKETLSHLFHLGGKKLLEIAIKFMTNPAVLLEAVHFLANLE